MIIIVNPFPLNDYQDFAGHRDIQYKDITLPV